MKPTHRIHVCFIIFLIHYFEIMNSPKVRQDSLHFDSIMNLTQYESISVIWANCNNLVFEGYEWGSRYQPRTQNFSEKLTFRNVNFCKNFGHVQDVWFSAWFIWISCFVWQLWILWLFQKDLWGKKMYKK